MDIEAVNLAKAIRQKESNGDFKAVGDNGTSTGAYQFQPDTWKRYSKEILGTDNVEMTPANQNAVAYGKIKQWKDSGKNAAEIAAMWNAGESIGEKWVSHKGQTTINGKVISYDTPAYVKEVTDLYHKIKGDGQPQTTEAGQPDAQGFINSANIPEPTPTPEVQNLKAETGQGIVGKTVGFLGGLSGTEKLGQGAGYAISNALGTQESNIQAQNKGQDIQTSLIQRIREKKARGEDTTKLQKALDELTGNLGTQGQNISDIGTGGISNQEVIGSAVQTGGNIIAASSALNGLSNLVKGGSALASEPVTSLLTRYAGKDAVSALSSAEKVNAITEGLASAEPAVKPILSKALQELAPQVLKEAGVGSFSELNPGIAKTIGLSIKAIKSLGRLGLGLTAGYEARGLLDRLTK